MRTLLLLLPLAACAADDSLSATTAALDADVKFWFEGEQAVRTGAMQIGDSGTASTGQFLYIAGPGEARYSFSSPIETVMTVWVRVIAPSSSANSFYVELDLQSQLFSVPVSTSWQWVPVQTNLLVGEGSQQLRIFGAEAGVKIDRILLADSAAFVPVVQTIQAEAYGWVPPMATGTQKTFPPTTYIWVPNGAGNDHGLVQLEAGVPYEDNYVVWGRFNAPTTADNSVYLAKWPEERQIWNVPTTSSTSWRWDRAAVSGEPIMLELDRSSYIEIANREDGTKLDKIVITNDMGFVAVEPPPIVATP